MLSLRRSLAMCILLTVAAVFPLPAQTAVQVYSEGVEAYKQGDVETAKHKFALALEIDKNFRPASALLSRIVADERNPAPGISYKALQTTLVPVEFKDTTLDSALEFLRQRTDEVTHGKLKINFAVNLPPELAGKRVTLKLDRVPIIEVLRYMGESAGVSFQVQKYAIAVTPASAPVSTPAPGATP